MTQDEQTLHDLVKGLQDAWNAADHTGFTAPFADDAIFIHIFGGQIDGRREIEEAHRFIFNGIYKGSRNLYTVRSVRFLRPDTAVVLVEAHLRFEAEGEPREIHARPTLIATKENGRWVFQMFQNTSISKMPGAK